ncbi:SMP-30/gluconolactonase/LRE family protein [Streptomyces sp. NPDC015171]|uniref:SMP-30/gluconolactonase/LRE family protein n=1 Tax=Streptomyces sp. NPDC015171 TaxID=3364945 RepID=UPI0036FC9F82
MPLVSRPLHRRTFLTATAAALAAVAAPATAHAATGPRVSRAFTLPGDRAYPEGITLDRRTGDVYVGSFTTGEVYRAAAGSSEAEVFLPAGTDGRTTANGLKTDRAGRLWVTDHSTGIAVYDLRDRSLLARFDMPDPAAGFLNDVVITPDGTAYVTDSVRPLIHRVTPAEVARARGGRLPLTPAFDLGAALPAAPSGAHALNGIVADTTGRFLFVVDMPGGGLYRVDTTSGAVRRVALHGGDLTHGDGLELHGRTLWAVHNVTDTLTRWQLSATGTSARLRRRLTTPALQLPTTLVRERDHLLVVRSQFDKGGPMGEGVPRTPFTVARVTGM